MPHPKPDITKAAAPKLRDQFDPWNSSSTGHQRAENRLSGSTGWRQSRGIKLSNQFKSGESGGKRISDTVGAGAAEWDEKAKAITPNHVQDRAKYNIKDMLLGQKCSNSVNGADIDNFDGQQHLPNAEERLMAKRKDEDDTTQDNNLKRASRIFDGLVIYVNGSTYPLISDHKLKHLLAEHGAKLSIHLGRRTVTHVILGRPSNGGPAGAGGGLAGTKLEKEIRKVGGCGLKYIGVEWVLESVKAGKRLPEVQFSNLKVAPKAQKSVYGIVKSADPGSTI